MQKMKETEEQEKVFSENRKFIIKGCLVHEKLDNP